MQTVNNYNTNHQNSDKPDNSDESNTNILSRETRISMARFGASPEFINSLEPFIYKGNIIVADCTELIEPALEIINNEPLIGLDTETKPNFKKEGGNPLALIQLASAGGVALFRLSELGMPKQVADILQNPLITKICQNAPQELKELYRDFKIVGRSFVDLVPLAEILGCFPLNIRALSAIFLNAKVSKTARLSNWSNSRLTVSQINYAATDAWVTREIFLAMQKILKADGYNQPLEYLSTSSAQNEKKARSKNHHLQKRRRRKSQKLPDPS